MSPTERIAPSVRYVRSLEGKYYLLREAAEMLGVSHRTLRNLISEDPEKLGPAFYTYLGKIKIYLYTDDDIDRLRKYFDAQKAIYPITEPDPMKQKGRPAKWTPEQRKLRQRKFSQVHYYKQQAEKHLKAGDEEKAAKAIGKMKRIQMELRNEDSRKTHSNYPKGLKKEWQLTEPQSASPTNSSLTEIKAGSSSNSAEMSQEK